MSRTPLSDPIIPPRRLTTPVASAMSGGTPLPPPPAPPPPWVTQYQAPSGDLPRIVLDFANGQYWSQATGVVGVGSIVFTDPSWGTFDPTTITPGLGLLDAFSTSNANIEPACFGPAWMTAGYTILFRVTGSPTALNDPTFGGGHTFNTDLYDTSFVADMNAFAQGVTAGANFEGGLNDWGYVNQVFDDQPITSNLGYVAVNMTINGTQAASVMGGAIVTQANGPAPLTPTNVVVYGSGGSGSHTYLETAVLWDLQANADLPAIAGTALFPVWLPAAPSGDRPLIYADFVAGLYWGNGAALELTDVFENNSDWGTFSPSSIVAGDGLNMLSPNCGPALTPAMFSLITSNITFRIATTFNAIDDSFVVNAGRVNIAFTNSQFSQFANSAAVNTMRVTIFPPNPAGLDVPTVDVATVTNMAYAVTMLSDQTKAAVQGSVVAAGAVDPSPDAAQLFGIGCGADLAGFVTSLAIYSLQSDADLPSLSTP